MDRIDQIISDMPKRCALARLIGQCNAICASGNLGPYRAASLRDVIAEVEAAFAMPSSRESA